MSVGTALIITLLVSLLPDSLAVDYCYHRAGITGTSNGTAIRCTGLPYCFSHYDHHDRLYSHAGCTSLVNVCSSYPSCVVCNTDYCNSATPSSIVCNYYNSRVNYMQKQNCTTGISTCYVYSSDGMSIYGGCGTCSGTGSSNCRVCNTSLCNSPLPPVINCYSRSSSLTVYTGPGSVLACQNGISTCYSFTDGTNTYGGCGTCNSKSCITCSTNLCNTHLPSNISCFYRNGRYVYTYSSSGSNGTLTQCSTGVTTCYSYRQQINSYYYNDYSECGVCNSSDPFCTNCNSSGCNYFRKYFHLTTSRTSRTSSSTTRKPPVPSTTRASTTTRVTSAPSITTVSVTTSMPSAPSAATGGVTTSMSPTTSASISVATTPTSTGNPVTYRPFTMKCYFTFGETDYSKRAKVTCTSTSCFQFSFGRGTTDYFFAGCGNCSLYSSLFINCQTCFEDYCNSGQDLIVGAKLQIAACVCSLIVMLMNMQLI